MSSEGTRHFLRLRSVTELDLASNFTCEANNEQGNNMSKIKLLKLLISLHSFYFTHRISIEIKCLRFRLKLFLMLLKHTHIFLFPF